MEKLTTLLCFGLLYNVPYVKSLVNSNLIQRVMCIELWIVESVLLRLFLYFAYIGIGIGILLILLILPRIEFIPNL